MLFLLLIPSALKKSATVIGFGGRVSFGSTYFGDWSDRMRFGRASGDEFQFLTLIHGKLRGSTRSEASS